MRIYVWVGINSESWWWTGRPGMCCPWGHRVGHDWATELNWRIYGWLLYNSFNILIDFKLFHVKVGGGKVFLIKHIDLRRRVLKVTQDLGNSLNMSCVFPGLTWWQMVGLLWHWCLNDPRSSLSITLSGSHGMSFMWWIPSSWRKKKTTFPAVTWVALWGPILSSCPRLYPPFLDHLLKTVPLFPRHR